MHDIQSDMGHEGSGAGGAPINDDDEEYGGMHNSGDGSGDGELSLLHTIALILILYISFLAIFRFHNGLRYHRHHAQHWR